MPASSYLRSALLNHIRGGAAFAQPSDIYVQPHWGNPGATGLSNTFQFLTFTYSSAQHPWRAWVSFGAATGGQIKNDITIQLDIFNTSEAGPYPGDPPEGDISYVSYWDAAVNGNYLGYSALSHVVDWSALVQDQDAWPIFLPVDALVWELQ